LAFAPVRLAALANVVALIHDDRSKKLKHMAKARVNEKVFHAFFSVSVADLLE